MAAAMCRPIVLLSLSPSCPAFSAFLSQPPLPLVSACCSHAARPFLSRCHWPLPLPTARLPAPLPAPLQDASVHEILENGGMVQRVLGELASTLFLLDDLEENINVFDARLRHMREDIAGGGGMVDSGVGCVR